MKNEETDGDSELVSLLANIEELNHGFRVLTGHMQVIVGALKGRPELITLHREEFSTFLRDVETLLAQTEGLKKFVRGGD